MTPTPSQLETRVLVVDDEPNIVDVLRMSLEFVGFDVDSAGTGQAAITKAKAWHPDIMLLDVMLPDFDGFEVVRRLRGDQTMIPVVFLTARCTPADAVRGLTVGGDDYVAKPFSLEELIARVRAVLRRSRGEIPAPPWRLVFSDLELDDDQRSVTRRGLPIDLSRKATADPTGEAERDAEARARRYLGFSKGDNGMTDIKGSVPDEDAAFIKSALDHIAGKAFDDLSGRTYPQRIADALTDLCKAYAAGTVTGGRERPKLIITVGYETIVARAAGRGVVIGQDVTLSGDAVRRLACDAGLHRLVTSGTSVTLDFGTQTRLASDSQYLVLVERDGGCRWPGCHRPPGWCDVHHIDEVTRDDGPTDIANLVLLCSAHHHLVHELRWRLLGNAHDLLIETPDGTILRAPPRGRTQADPSRHTEPSGDPGAGEQLGFDIAS